MDVNEKYLLAIADGARRVGLGHLSRSSSVILALAARGIRATCLAVDAEAPVEFDGVQWRPCHAEEARAAARVASAVLLDTYTLDRVPTTGPLVTFHDPGTALIPGARLVIAPASDARVPGWLCGLQYACLRPGYWGEPAVEVADAIGRVLITTGGTDPNGVSATLVAAARAAVPNAQLRRVLGPAAAGEPLAGVVELRAPRELKSELAAADLVICLGGQTALEAASLGVPTVVVTVVANQRANIERLARAGAVEAADLDGGLAALLGALAVDRDRRCALAASARQAVDGFGAIRVAAAIGAALESGLGG